MKRLAAKLARIDRKGYGAYKELRGSYDFRLFTLIIDHVQSDPYAPPSRCRVLIPQEVARFPRNLFRNKPRRIALEDFLLRAFQRGCAQAARKRGSGKSGLITALNPSPAVLPRTAVSVDEDKIIVRFQVGLPAHGRRIAAAEARAMFFEELPMIVRGALLYENLNSQLLLRHVTTVEDAEALRAQLEERDLVGFVANGAILPRESGVSQRPLRTAIPFSSPLSLEVELETPNRGPLRGMGVPEGVTLIVGGGYHGKSTLLDALAEGVYNHIPGDGREFVVVRGDAVKIRAEDGRFVENVDISPFITNLPLEIDTRHFSTRDASGSTSQAANIIEALEVGSKLLLIDEDTSATNFLIRDEKMQQLVSKDEEPITPLVEKVRPLYREHGVSVIMIMGGSGEFFPVADTVIKLREFRPYDVTAEAREIAARYGLRASAEAFGAIKPRRPLGASLEPHVGGKLKLKVRDRRVQFGREEIDLAAVEQLVEPGQLRTIAYALLFLKGQLDGRTTLAAALDRLERLVEEQGLLALLPHESGEYSYARRFEIAAALNRLRTLRTVQEV